MATKSAYKRLTKEYLAIQANPPPYVIAKPLESNILEWHYVLRGPQATDYEAGEYHGVLKFPSEYPFKPPAIQFVTPSGRFQPNTDICLTMSNFHPSLWNPSWSVATILNGVLSFMVEEETTTGSVRATQRDRRTLAAKSHLFNLANPVFRDVFPELCTPIVMPLPPLHPPSLTNQPPTVPVGTGLFRDSSTPMVFGAANHSLQSPMERFHTPHTQLRARPTTAGVMIAAHPNLTEIESTGAATEVTDTASAPFTVRGLRWFRLSSCHKITVVFFIFMYLVAAKLIQRAMASTN
ncbi:Ubiquitin-conjugating enzyme E2 6 [Dimargaris verticillata]|uniref:Ubiquitin-conjugating enzyme E2 6 n=1 Tax=Dimargaris verticillata TaxID=2761393 RepID=A0A9W8EBX6_9FUNG|nr:Ubiquitin-conjugating enzyme E2 6 [Dimargaris verticillata]